MKKTILSLSTALLLTGTSFAQQDMSSVWEKNPTHKIEWTGMSEENGLVYTSSLKEITVYKPETGEQLWNKDFKDLAPNLRKVDELIPMWDAKVFFIFNRRSGGDMMAVVDMLTGQPLWNSDQFEDLTDENIVYVPEAESFAVSTKKALTFLKARSGQVLWETAKFKGVVGAYVADAAEGTITMLNYKPTGLAALFAGFKNQITKVNLKNGDVIWDQTYRGGLEKKVYTKEALARISLKGDKLFLFLNGLQVFEYKSGKPVWSAAYDETPKVKGRPLNAIRYGIYGAIADPMVVDNDVYILDIQNPRKQYIKKYELESGKLIWTSPEIEDAKAIPNMYLADGVIVLQVGGTVEEQGYYKEKQTDGSILYYYEKDYIEVKPFNVQGFDAASGKSLWQSEKMKKGITNLFPDGNDIIVCSGKALYKLDSKTGQEKYEFDITKDGVSQANKILDYKDNVVVVCDKGLSIHKKSDGSLVKSAKYRRAVPVEVKSNGLGNSSSGKNGINKLSGFKSNASQSYSTIAGNSVALQTKGGDIAVYNLDDCSFKQIDARKNAKLLMTDDGNYVYVFEGGGMVSKSIVTKYKTK